MSALLRRFFFAVSIVGIVTGCSNRRSAPAPADSVRRPTAVASSRDAVVTDASADVYVPAAPPGPTGTIEGTVYLDGPIRRVSLRLEVRPAWRNNPGCRDAALRYSQPFDVMRPGPFPGALVAAEARESAPAPVRDRVFVFRDCDVIPRVMFATQRDRIVFHPDTRLHHVPRIVGPGIQSPIAQVLIPGQPDQEKDIPRPGRYLITVQDLPEWVGAMLFVLPNRFIDQTDAQGRFRITEVPVGEVRVHAWYPGATEDQTTVTVRPGETTRVDFHLRQLPPAPPPSSSTVRDTGIPVPP